MQRYIISFRIDEKTEGYDADERRQSLYDAVDLIASAKWEAPTSFYGIETSIDKTSEVLKRITVGLDKEVDVVFIRRVDFIDTMVWGSVGDDAARRALATIFPKLKFAS